MTSPTLKDVKYIRWAVSGAALFSTCGKAQYMAIVVDKQGTVIGTGYNGGPSGWTHCNAGGCPRFKEQTAQGGSYDNCIAIHAEVNALLRVSGAQTVGATLYVSGLPCLDCAKVIAGTSIKRVVYLTGRTPSDAIAIHDYMARAHIELIQVT